MSPLKFEIFLVFSYFLRSYVLSRLTTYEPTWIPSLLYQISRFVLLVVNRSVLKHCKVPKYYDQDCLKIFFLLSILQKLSQISLKKNAHLVQKG